MNTSSFRSWTIIRNLWITFSILHHFQCLGKRSRRQLSLLLYAGDGTVVFRQIETVVLVEELKFWRLSPQFLVAFASLLHLKKFDACPSRIIYKIRFLANMWLLLCSVNNNTSTFFLAIQNCWKSISLSFRMLSYFW